MRVRRRTYGTALAVVAASGALVAGCGGSDDSSTTPALSQSEYVAKATAICKPAQQRIEAAAHRYLGSGGRPTAVDFEQFATQAVVPETKRVIEQFQALIPPANREANYGAMVHELLTVDNELKANPQLLAQQGDPFAKANGLAQLAGLQVCAAD